MQFTCQAPIHLLWRADRQRLHDRGIQEGSLGVDLSLLVIVA
jgi:hypothetical protein